MAKKKPQNNTSVQKTQNVLEEISAWPLEKVDLLQKSLPTLIQTKYESQLMSPNIEDVMKANMYADSMRGSKNHIKSVFFDPNSASDGAGYKATKGGATFYTLQKMGDISIIKAIINTRVEQVQNFLKFSTDEQKEGFQIRKKRSIFDEDTTDLSDDEKRKAEEIVEFLENGGLNDKWETTDNFQDFVRKIVRDSLTIDQLTFECVRDRSFNLRKFKAVDAAMIRLLDTADPRFAQAFEQYRWKGYLPRYAMVWNNQILRNPTTDQLIMYYPWELGYGIRNKSTNILQNGYGTSELETLIEIMTWILWGMQYNGNFFKQGSQPKGFINIKGGNIDNSTLNEFRQAWTQTMRGVQNSHKVPVIQGIDLEWIDLQHGNRDMEFNEWLRFLFILTCSVYRIDPSELGFNFQEQARMFGQEGQKARLEHSKNKGLKPLIIFLQNIINKYLVSELAEDYEFVFTGVEVEDEEKQVKLDGEKLSNGMVSLEDMFQKYSGRDFDPNKDTILNQVYQTAQQSKMMGGEWMNSFVDGQDNENVFAEYEQQTSEEEENPILSKALDYIDQTWGAK